MSEHGPKTSIAGILMAVVAVSAAFAWWRFSPWEGEFNTIIAAVVIAFCVDLLTPARLFLALLAGVSFIAFSLLVIVQQDASGLGPPQLTIPIQSIFASGPMAGAACVGHWLRRQLSPRDKSRPTHEKVTNH